MRRALLALTLLASPVLAQQTVKMDEQAGVQGAFTAYPSPWCRYVDTTLLAGRDYQNTIAYQTGGLPVAQVTWRVPGQPSAKCGVYGYDALSWGNYDNGANASPVTPRQVSAIADLTFGYGVDAAANPAGYNGLAEFYLTTAPGRADLKALEIGWYWHAPVSTQKFAAAGKPLGIFTDRYGRKWSAALVKGGSSPFVTFIPAGNDLSWGTIDGKGALIFLQAQGVVSPSWWFNGAAIGVEPVSGFGTAVVRTWTPKLIAQ